MQSTSPASASPSSQTFFARHQFLIRRLHSLSGLLPIGAFLVMHLTTNSTILASLPGNADFYQSAVDKIHALGPLLVPVEWVTIFLPLIFHTVIGFVIIGGALPNATEYPYPRNIRYTLQRATGIIAFFYIMWHVLHMHNLGSPLKSVSPDLFAAFDPHDASKTAAKAIQTGIWVQIVYAIGILACVYHLANGLWTMGITWGVWTSPAAMRRADYVCSTFGVLLAIVGLSALAGFATYPVPAASSSEPGTHRSPSAVLQESHQAPLPGLENPTGDPAPAASPAATPGDESSKGSDGATDKSARIEVDLSGLDKVDAQNAAAAAGRPDGDKDNE